MENVVLIIHLLLALCLIGVVLLQRSEGGGLGMGGGGGGGGGLVTARGAANVLTRLTWIFAIAFIATSITLTILAARDAADSSILDNLTPSADAPAVPALPAGEDLLPPSSDAAPAVPAPSE